MKVHVIFAHPLEDSFNAALFRLVTQTLEAEGHEVDSLDLYRDNFDPVLSPQDRIEYHDVTINQHRVADYVKRLQSTDVLVLCHPVWNFGWPAIMKGYFDRVFLPRQVFRVGSSQTVHGGNGSHAERHNGSSCPIGTRITFSGKTAVQLITVIDLLHPAMLNQLIKQNQIIVTAGWFQVRQGFRTRGSGGHHLQE